MDEPADTFDNSDVALDQIQTEGDNLDLNTFELDLKIKEMIEKNEGLWQCKVCDLTLKHKGHMKSHVETHMEGVTHTCHICHKSYSTRNSLQQHNIRKHSLA